MSAESSAGLPFSFAIDGSTRNNYSVSLSGGTLDLTGNVTGDVTLGGVTIPSQADLRLKQARSVTKGTTGAVINGDLFLNDDTTLAIISDLDLTGSGQVNTSVDTSYIYLDDKWVSLITEDFSDGLDISGPPASPTAPPTVKTAYKAGTGIIVWAPTLNADSALTGGTLTFNSAQITVSDFVCTNFFSLPNVPVDIVLTGTNTFSTEDLSSGAPIPNSVCFFFTNYSVTMTGTGSIDSTTGSYFIEARTGSVTLNGYLPVGTIAAESAILNGVTIDENQTLNLSGVENVSATNVVNNGKLVLKRAADTTADIAAINPLNLTGDGYVEARAELLSNYYANDGTVIPSIAAPMLFDITPAEGGWSPDASLEDNGYEFSGDSTNGYTLTLGNLIMNVSDPSAALRLPCDGPVTIVLADGTTTRVTNYTGSAMSIFTIAPENVYPCAITGTGRLFLDSWYAPCLRTEQPLTISGTDITITSHYSSGIDATNVDCSISKGGRLKIVSAHSAITAGTLTLNNMAIIDPADAAFNPTFESICDENGDTISSVTIEAIVVTSVTVSPEAASVLKGESKTFTAGVAGIHDPAQTVTWTVEGGITGTTIDEDGKLTVADGETATTLTVRATSTVDTAKSGTATVTVITPTFPVTLPSGTGYTATAEAGSESPVIKGNSYSFKITLGNNYEKGADFAVKANGTVLTPNYDIYTIENVTAEQTVTVEGVVLKDADYRAVALAIADIPADLTPYTDATVKALHDAVGAVVGGKNITEQATVDKYASDIQRAIITLQYKSAVYAKVNAAIEKIPADISLYTDATVKALTAATSAVIQGKDVSEQATVDGYAVAIENAIAALKYKDADYSAVDAAIEKIPADLTPYTDETVKALNAAKAAVVRGKNITEQATVDGYAAAIESAISALAQKPVKQAAAPQTGDAINIALWITLLFLSGGAVTVLAVTNKRKKANER